MYYSDGSVGRRRVSNISMALLREAFLAVTDASRADYRLYRKMKACYFEPDNYSKMNVMAASRVMSRTMLRIIDDYLRDKDDFTKGRYEGLKCYIEKVDVLWRIINSQQHVAAYKLEELEELLEILEWFLQWGKRNQEEGRSEFLHKTLLTLRHGLLWLLLSAEGYIGQS